MCVCCVCVRVFLPYYASPMRSMYTTHTLLFYSLYVLPAASVHTIREVPTPLPLTPLPLPALPLLPPLLGHSPGCSLRLRPPLRPSLSQCALRLCACALSLARRRGARLDGARLRAHEGKNEANAEDGGDYEAGHGTGGDVAACCLLLAACSLLPVPCCLLLAACCLFLPCLRLTSICVGGKEKEREAKVSDGVSPALPTVRVVTECWPCRATLAIARRVACTEVWQRQGGHTRVARWWWRVSTTTSPLFLTFFKNKTVSV